MEGWIDGRKNGRMDVCTVNIYVSSGSIHNAGQYVCTSVRSISRPVWTHRHTLLSVHQCNQQLLIDAQEATIGLCW